MTTITIFLQRHFQKTGDALSDEGIQAATTCRSTGTLAGINFDAYYASPTNRAQETASIIAGDRNLVTTCYGLLPALSDDVLQEYWIKAGDNTEIFSFFNALSNNWGDRLRHQYMEMLEEIIEHNTKLFPEKDGLNLYFCGHSQMLECLLQENGDFLDYGECVVLTYQEGRLTHTARL